MMNTTMDNAPAPLETSVSVTSRNILQIMLQHKWLIVLGAALGLVGGILVYAQKQPVYQSNASILVVKRSSDALPVSGGDPRSSYFEDYVATHLVLIKSPLVVSTAVEKKELKKLKSFANVSDPTGVIIGGLSASRSGGKDDSAPKNIIELSYRGIEPGDTKLVISAVIASYREFLDATYQNVSNNTVQLITNARDILTKDLKQKEDAYRTFRANNPLMWRGPDGTNIHLMRIKELQQKQTGLDSRAEEIRQRILAIQKAKIEGKSPTAILSLATRPFEREAKETAMEKELEATLFPLYLKEKALLQDYGEDHPEVIRVREQIFMTKNYFDKIDTISKRQYDDSSEDATKRIEKKIEAQVEMLKHELALLESSNNALVNVIEEESRKARNLEHIEFQDDSYRADIARTNRVLEQTLKRLEEISLIKDGGFEAKVITEPSIGYKVSPVMTQIVLSGLMLGLVAGMGLAYLLDMADKSFRTPEEIRKRLGLPIVGHIPYLAHTNDPVELLDDSGQPIQIDASLCALHRPNSMEAEAYRSVRTSLYFSTQGERHKVIQVTSPNMSDGKSTLIANLAITIAQSGRRVVLIDADLRRPRVHRMFGLSAKVGLAQLITDVAEIPDVIQKTIIPNLSILPAGPRPSNPAELLTHQRLAEILDVMRDQFDYVLVDTPPLLAVSDPCAVAPRVDGVILTIRVSKNGRPSAERARDILAGLKVHVFGVVVNGVGKQGAMSGYGYEHYEYTYSYTSDYTTTDNDEVQETKLSSNRN